MYKFWLISLIVLSFLSLSMYILQVKMIFMPEKLSGAHRFHFTHPFEEHFVNVSGARLNALYFADPEETARGLH